MNSTIGSLIGFFVGIPVSYWFQSEMVRAKFSVGDYLAKGIPEVLDALASGNMNDNTTSILITIVISCIVCSVVGWFLGRFAEKSIKS